MNILNSIIRMANRISEKLNINKKTQVHTYDGKIANLSDCIQIHGEFYLKGDKFLKEDYFLLGKYCNLRRALSIYTKLNEKGYPDKNSIGYTYSNEHIKKTFVLLTKDNETNFIDYNLLLEFGYVECLESGKFFHPEIAKLAKISKTGTYRKVNTTKKFILGDIAYNHKYGLDSSTYSISEGKEYTFGVEIETCRGFLPVYLDEKLNYQAVHDGSLREPDGSGPFGGEYVTGVLKGDMGFRQLKMLCTELSKRCLVDKRCGVHVHLGGINFNKEFIVYMYYLARKLEGEINSILPHSRRNNEFCKKLKSITINLTQKFESASQYKDYINDCYEQILMFVSSTDKLDPIVLSKKNDHPMGNKCGFNHNTARYAWLNFVPAMFNTRGNESYTIEIRNFNASTNYIKIRNYLLIFMGIVNVVENYKTYIMNNKDITLENVIELSYNKKSSELIKFIIERREKFKDKDSAVSDEESEYKDEFKDNNVNLKSL